MSVTRVALIDDHPRIHEAVAGILRTAEDISLVAQGGNGEEALAICASIHPDIILMDVVMPIMDGIEATRHIREHYPEIRVLVLSSIDDHESVRAMLLNGASGYILKGGLATELIPTLRSIRAGQGVFSPRVVRQLTQDDDLPRANTFNLTDRELAVLGLLAEGLTLNEISSRLKITASTVKFHLTNIQDKLGVTTRAEALVLAAKHNLI